MGLPQLDVAGDGPRSNVDTRKEALREVRVRANAHIFRRDVLRAYRQRCTVCALREPDLVEAAHIVDYADETGISAVVNGLALCAIHHRAYDRNLLGIDPDGIVHIARSLREMKDGPMLESGLRAFHGSAIELPRRKLDRPDPERLATRFGRFAELAA